MTPGFVGIDLGTSAVKVIVQDDAGRSLASASRPYPTAHAAPGWAEQDPADWWHATCGALVQALGSSGATIRAVGLSGQLNGFVLIGADGHEIGAAPIWLDQRGVAEAEAIAAAADVPGLTGNAMTPIAVASKLAWLRAHDPARLDRAAHVLMVKDWLLWRLTGEIATDPSDAASTAMAKADGTAWEPALVRSAGVAGTVLPPIRPSASLGGRVTRTAALATGLPEGTPVAVGAGDVTALAVGCGLVAAGRVAITLGTAGHVVAPALRPGGLADLGLWRIPHALAGQTLLLGLIMSGGLSLSWLRHVLAAGGTPPPFAALEALAAAVPPGSHGVTFLPFLDGAATPHRRPDLRGAFMGLSSAHGAGDMVRAVMEGVAMAARDCTDALAAAGAEIAEIRLAEGGAQSRLWCQIIADTLDRPVAVLAERDTSAAGAALIGRALAEGADLASISEDACGIAQVVRPLNTRAMTESFVRYRNRLGRLLE